MCTCVWCGCLCLLIDVYVCVVWVSVFMHTGVVVWVGGCMQACSCDMNTTFDFLDVVIPFVGLIVSVL